MASGSKPKSLPDYQVKKMPLKNLKDNPRNPRTISDQALKGLITSLEEFGLIEPIVYNKRTGFIVGGHQRVKALRAAGYKEAQVLIVDFPEEKELLANLSLNNPKIQGEFSQDAGDLIGEMMLSNENLGHALLLDDLGDSFKVEEKPDRVKPAVPFTEEIFEESNYVVLTFKNKADWVWLQSIFPLQTVQALNSKPGFEKMGVGRVVDGVKFLRTVTGQ